MVGSELGKSVLVDGSRHHPDVMYVHDVLRSNNEDSG
jgi:hypothetical protein